MRNCKAFSLAIIQHGSAHAPMLGQDAPLSQSQWRRASAFGLARLGDRAAHPCGAVNGGALRAPFISTIDGHTWRALGDSAFH